MADVYDIFNTEYHKLEKQQYEEHEPTGKLQKQLEEKFQEFQERSAAQDSEITYHRIQLEKQTVVISQLLLRLSELEEQFEAFKKQQSTEEVIEIRNIPLQQIKNEMLSLLTDKKTRYADDIAAELKLDIKDVIEAFKQLQKEGKLFVDEASL